MASKKPFDVAGKSDDQLKTELLNLRKEQMNLRFQKATGQMEKPNRWREVRKTIAQIKTEISSRRQTNAAAAK